MHAQEDVQLCSLEVCKGTLLVDQAAAVDLASDDVTSQVRGFLAHDGEEAGEQQDREADGGDAVGAN